jgi:hypothetical protein
MLKLGAEDGRAESAEGAALCDGARLGLIDGNAVAVRRTAGTQEMSRDGGSQTFILASSTCKDGHLRKSLGEVVGSEEGRTCQRKRDTIGQSLDVT